MSNSIIEILNLVDNDLEVIDQYPEGNLLIIELRKKVSLHICPICGATMYSKGYYKRSINHPIFQDGRNIKLILHKRKYKCPNANCNYMDSDHFQFAPSGKHNTNLLPLLILREFENINATATDVAKRLNVSDSLVYDTFLKSFEFERLALTEVISVDEVYMNFDSKHKYSMVILDFIKSEPIDLLYSRREADTAPYFNSIPYSERANVKYLICDMYNQYINYSKRYFPNAIVVIDSFHVIKWLNDQLRYYYNGVKKKYIDKRRKELNQKNHDNNTDYLTIKDSKELHILKSYKYFLFSNKDNIEYSIESKKDYFLNQYLDTYQKEKMFFDLDSKFKLYRDMKEEYIEFSNDNSLSKEDATRRLNELIDGYLKSGERPFVSFARTLNRFKPHIINSFNYVDVIDNNGKTVKRRLSNGPIESFNTKPKTLKRLSHGIKNFDYARSRILLATRKTKKLKVK